MTHFTGPLVIEEIGYERWRVVRSFIFYSDTGIMVPVESGFETDLASIPGLARSFVHKIGYWSQPAVVHDLCYWGHRSSVQVAKSASTGKYIDISRKKADKLFRSGCRVKEQEYDIPLYKQRTPILYAGVRAGGSETWETPKERIERLARFSNNDIIDN